MTEFWSGSGYPLLCKNPDGYLDITDDFIRSYLTRPELAPIPESCDHERWLHAALIKDPRSDVTKAELDSIEDDDSKENYQFFLSLRTLLVASGNLENGYLSLFKKGAINVPPVLIENMAQVIVQNILGDTDDPYKARAAELFFRTQMITLSEGGILAGDSETVEAMAKHAPDLGNIGRMLIKNGIKPKSAEFDVLNEDNADQYWQRSDLHDMVFDATFGRKGIEAFCDMMALWIDHFLHAKVKITPVQSITDDQWLWHIGLDKDATLLLNDLYHDKDIEPERMERLISLFRLDFINPEDMREDIKGHPVYMGLCMGNRNKVVFKPQNLLFNLPLASPPPLFMNN